jgi:hypothetical protein
MNNFIVGVQYPKLGKLQVTSRDIEAMVTINGVTELYIDGTWYKSEKSMIEILGRKQVKKDELCCK